MSTSLLSGTTQALLTIAPRSDLKNATSADYEERHAVAMEIQRASLTAGFFYSKRFSRLNSESSLSHFLLVVQSRITE